MLPTASSRRSECDFKSKNSTLSLPEGFATVTRTVTLSLPEGVIAVILEQSTPTLFSSHLQDVSCPCSRRKAFISLPNPILLLIVLYGTDVEIVIVILKLKILLVEDRTAHAKLSDRKSVV